MTTIRAGISVNHASVRQIDTAKLRLVDFADILKIRKFEPSTLGQRQQQLDAQNNMHQSTVIEKAGKIIATLGDNGFKFFQNSIDYQARFTTSSDDRIITALRNQYGSLTVSRYDKGQGPTAGEIFEKIHGYPAPRIVDFTV